MVENRAYADSYGWEPSVVGNTSTRVRSAIGCVRYRGCFLDAGCRAAGPSAVPDMRLFVVLLVLASIGPAYADSVTYEDDFVDQVTKFANLNRLSISRLHRDIHADCYIPVTISTIILRDGSVKEISIEKTSTVPVVDRYFRYIVEQAAPYSPLGRHFDPAPDEVTITHEFRLDVRLWSDGITSTRPCQQLRPRN